MPIADISNSPAACANATNRRRLPTNAPCLLHNHAAQSAITAAQTAANFKTRYPPGHGGALVSGFAAIWLAPGAVVFTNNVNAPGVPGLTCTVVGEVAGIVVIEQLASHWLSGCVLVPEHARLTVPANPPDESILRLNCSCWPAGTGSLTPCPDAGWVQNSIAVPLSEITGGVPGALSFSVSDALLAPPLAPHVGAEHPEVPPWHGWNFTEIEQLWPGGVFAPVHASLTNRKSAAFVPVLVTEVTVSAPAYWPVEVFVTFTDSGVPAVPMSCGANGGIADTVILGCVAPPESGTVAGVPPEILSVADRGPGPPEASGLNVTAIWQLLFAPKLGAQEFPSVKSPMFAPLSDTFPIDAAVLPALDTETFTGPLFVPIA
jgi:hypothetical protein